MKSVKDIRDMIEAPDRAQRVLGMFEIRDILLAMLDHIDRSNGRTEGMGSHGNFSDIMREVAEGRKQIVSADLINRYQAVAIRIWGLFPHDPLSENNPAQFYIERLEAILDEGLLAPAAASDRQDNTVAASPDARDRNMSEHFNELTPAEHERLSLLNEELGEAIQVIGKILRHGFDSNWEGRLPETNREMLEKELGDIGYARELMLLSGDINLDAIRIRQASKALTIGEFLHHQVPCAVDYTKPHKFDLQKETGLPHVEYRICKCGLSEGNVIHV